MARLLIYDAYENKVYTYANLNENDPMPYSTLTTLRLREFRGKSASPTLWTTIAAMEAWNLTRRKYGRGIPVGYAFRRIWEGGHGTRSQHYAGVAFDVGQSLDQRQRTAIYNAARATGAWGYVEPLSQTPTWVHFDRRYGTPACNGTTAGYPTLRRGSRGCYVMILQDALSTLGYQTGSRIDGIFGARTEQALRGYQKRTSLRVDGVCGCDSWKKISTAVIGIGRTKTTIDSRLSHTEKAAAQNQVRSLFFTYFTACFSCSRSAASGWESALSKFSIRASRLGMCKGFAFMASYRCRTDTGILP